MEQILFEMDINKKYLSASRKEAFFNYKSILFIFIIILFLGVFDTSNGKFIFEINFFLYQTFINILTFLFLYFLIFYILRKFIQQKVAITITKEHIQVENKQGIHIYKYEKFQNYSLSENYYILYIKETSKWNFAKTNLLLPKEKFTDEEKIFFEDILKENNLMLNK